jgi:hypothetical protein
MEKPSAKAVSAHPRRTGVSLEEFNEDGLFVNWVKVLDFINRSQESPDYGNFKF